MPLAGVFCKTIQEALETAAIPLTWVSCSTCTLVQVFEDIPDRVLFQNYNYASSTVAGLIRHFQSFSDLLRSRYGAGCSFCEIGCNDGVLLRMLPSDWRLSGVDPSDVARVAPQGSYTLYNAPFDVSLIREYGLEQAFDVITGSNCLAHISDLKEVFHAAALALREGGHFWVEVHDLAALLHGAQWDTIYHEHKVEWSEDSLCHCVLPLGFVLLSVERLPLHGGLLRVCFERSRSASASAADEANPPDFSSLRKAYSERYENPAVIRLQRAARSGSIAAYGASGRANVFVNQLLGLRFSFIVDEAPLRVNRFLPRTATPILGPDMLHRANVTHCLITAWNYKDDIIKKNSQFKGQWLTAF